MKLTTIPFTRFDPGNELARAYLCEPERVLPLFGADYRDPRSLRPLVDRQGSRERPRWGDLLAQYNQEVGGSVENARRLDEGFCVVSGQQVGLLFGPAYTTYKLLTTINTARVLEVELGVPVVPLFWVESEDHDWEEVNRFFWKGRRYRIEGEVAAGTPVARIDIASEPFLAEMRELLGETGEAWDLVRPEKNIARWHLRNLARLVAGQGVVFVEPALLRDPMRPLAEEIARRPEILDASLQRETGYPRPLAPSKGAYLFHAQAPRRRLERGAPVPEAWSADVASRVVLQNAAFPVLAAVCGPSEIAYWSQLRGAHEAFDVPMPAVMPRDAATLVEEGIARDAARLGLDLEAVVRGHASAPAREGGDPVALRLRRLAREANELSRALDEGLLDLPKNTDRHFARTVTRLETDLEKLARRLDDARAEMAGAGRRRYDRVLTELRPRGVPQERSHSLFPYLLRHGPGLAAGLLDSFDPYEIGHYLVRL